MTIGLLHFLAAAAAPGPADMPSDLDATGASAPLYWSDRLELPGANGVVGGSVVPAGEWEDVAAVVFSGAYVGCTGTLIAPSLVLTAAHCADGISDVILDTKDYASSQGEFISVSRVHVHPSYNGGGYDAAVLELSRPSTRTPRIIATDCVRDAYLRDGAAVAAVGYGATNTQGTQYGSQLREGFTDIDDADCAANYADGIFMGCEPSISPGGEIGAGGDGVDACFGDSGGPLYLLTPEGDAYLTGITSRAYAGIDPNYPCRDGGIWVRADAVMDWVEQVTNTSLERPQCNDTPQVSIDDVVVESGRTAEVRVQVVDDSSGWSATMIVPPAHGSVAVRAGGGVEYTADAQYAGPDDFTVEITDNGGAYPGSDPQSVVVTVDVEVVDAGEASQNGAEGSSGLPPFGDPPPEPAPGGVAYQRLGRSCSSAPTGPLGSLFGLILFAFRRTNRRVQP